MGEPKFLLVTLSLIILVGVPAMHSMMQMPTELVVGEEVIELSTGRSPASVDTQFKASNYEIRNTIKAKSVTVDFNCKSKDKNFVQETDGNLFRLKSDACLNEKWKDVSIYNKTNGYTAAVIFVNRGFTTDFMDLDEGENKLVVSGVNEHGQSIEHLLTVKRRAPASL